MNGSFKTMLTNAWAVIKKFFKRVWAYLKVAKMEYIVMIALFALDIASKAIVNATVGLEDTVVLIPKFLNIHNTHNYDAAFGAGWLGNVLGSMGSRIFFSIFAVIASVMFIIVLIRAKGGHRLFRVALAMVTAGAMGNCIDRMFLGYVRDFIMFEYFGLSIFGQTYFWIFNFADAELVIGVILIVIYFIFIYKDKDDHLKHALPEAQPLPVDDDATVAAIDESGEENPVDADSAEHNDGEVQEENNNHSDLNDLKNGEETQSANDNVEQSTEEVNDTEAPIAASDDGEVATDSVDEKGDSNGNTEKANNDSGESPKKRRPKKKAD